MCQAAVARGDPVDAVELAALALATGGTGQAEAARLVDQAISLARGDSNAGLDVAQAIVGLADPDLLQRGVKLLSDLDAGGDGSATRILPMLYVTGQVGPFYLPPATSFAPKPPARAS